MSQDTFYWKFNDTPRHANCTMIALRLIAHMLSRTPARVPKNMDNACTKRHGTQNKLFESFNTFLVFYGGRHFLKMVTVFKSDCDLQRVSANGKYDP